MERKAAHEEELPLYVKTVHRDKPSRTRFFSWSCTIPYRQLNAQASVCRHVHQVIELESSKLAMQQLTSTR
ncbi:MAG: hypothetical protein WAX67_12755 [Rugosibacter sp.]